MKTALLSAFSILSIAGALNADAQTAPPDRNAFHEAVQQCAMENDIRLPDRGDRPSHEDRQLIDACLEEKGISPPPHGRGGPHGKRPTEMVNQSEDPTN